jgi:hypothetical protein
MYRETQTVFTKKGKTATIIHDVRIVNGEVCYFHLIETGESFPYSKDAFQRAREFLRE